MADRPDDLDALAARLRAADALGRSDTINRLFDFLLTRSREGAAPKEIEVAEAVFGRRVSFDIAQDSTVRVNVHRLRKKLDDYYAGAGRGDAVRLSIPKGEYRLVAVAGAPPEAAVVDPSRSWTAGRLVLAGLVVLLALNLLLGAIWWFSSSQQGFTFARRAPAWKSLLADGRPITLVVGDYFIFGELDDHMEVSRLVREYEINSSEDLADYMMNNPEKGGKYTDVNLYYLPTSVAPALRSIMPILVTSPAERDRVHVVTSSQLTADMLKHNDIVYVGYLDRLGLLRDQVFGGSRYRVGETWDELLDPKSGKDYISQEGGPQGSETHRDYGYFSTFVGPNGNRIVVIAGTRDIGVVQTAEMVSGKEGLRLQAQKAGGMKSFEALYEVQGIDRVNLRGRLVDLSPIQAAEAWDLKTPLSFPTK
jgi:hypothetical protein